MPSAYLDALHMLSRRELTVVELRDRLLHRQHSDVEVERAIEHLLETGGLNDARVARAHARTAVDIKGRGRLRVQRELIARGIDRDAAAEAVGEVFGEKDERSLVARAIEKKLRRRAVRPSAPAEFARLYQFLMRQGFTPSVVTAEIEKLRRQKGREVQ